MSLGVKDKGIVVSLIAPVAALTALLIAASCVVIVYGAQRQNALAHETDETIADAIVRSYLRQAERTALDYAWWDELAAYFVIERNSDWIDINIGADAVVTTGSEAIFVIDAHGKIGHLAVLSEEPATFPRDLPFVLPLVEAAGAAATNPPVPLSAVIDLGGDLRIVALATITAQRSDTASRMASRPLHFIGFVRHVADDALSEWGNSLSLFDLKFEPQVPPSRASLAVKGASGEVVGHLTWEPRNPGSDFMTQLLPGAALFFLMAAIAFTVIARRITSVGERLQERERKLAERNAQLQESLAELEIATRRAQNADRAKSAFLATMSHEIRTPMNGILGMAQLLDRSSLDKTQKEQVEIILEAGASLLNLLNDLLDLSRIESGQIEIEDTEVDLAGIVRKCHATWLPRFRDKQLAFAVRESLDVSGELSGDPARIRQVLNNLVNNALKFTKEGGVEIHAATRIRSPDTVQLRVEVRDSGIGIAAEVQHRVFERFSQADSTISRRYGGSGLGLAISKELVELMGGQIGVETKVGIGSTFWFELPLRTAYAANEVAERKEAAA